MQSTQVRTSPLLRNFATRLDESCIQVTTKLGTQTLVRAQFVPATFPTDADLQLDFLKDLMGRANPQAMSILQDQAGPCIEDQAKAIRTILETASGTRQLN